MNNVTAAGGWDCSKKRYVPDSADRHRRFALQPGDVLFNATNSAELVGKTLLVGALDERTVFSNHFLRLRVDESRLSPAYLARWLQMEHRRRTFTGISRRWVNQASVDRERLLRLRLPLVPLSEQRRIVRALDLAEAVRRKRASTIVLHRAFAGDLFIGWFGNPASNPRRLPTATLGELGELDRGVSRYRPRNAPELLGGPYPLIQTGDVSRAGDRIRQWSATYSETGLKQSRLWPAGTLCITIAANIADAAILDFEACFPDSVVGFVSDPATTEYVRVWLGLRQRAIEAAAPESAQKNINLGILRDMSVPVPSQSVREDFLRAVSASTRVADRHRAHLHHLDALFASLQHRAFAGEL